MKTLIRYLILLVWLVLNLLELALAREVNLAWDDPVTAEQVTSWRVWDGSVLIATPGTPAVTVTLTDAAATLTVTALNAAGESLHSQPLVIPAASPPPPPIVRLVLQKSTDLQLWQDDPAVLPIELPATEAAAFYRLRVETP